MKVILLCSALIVVISISNANGTSKGSSISSIGANTAPLNKGLTPKGNHATRKTDRTQNPAPKITKKMVRAPLKEIPLSPEIAAINDRLKMDGDKKELTMKQAKWIERFITTINNWLYLVHVVLKMDKFKQLYKEHMQEEFDMWITGRKDQPFDMIYRNELDPKERPVHYKLIIYRISLSGLGYAEFNLKSLEIGFERSKNKMETPDGEMVYRKDRVYTLELEAELPVTDIKIKHELVNGNEEGQFDPLQNDENQAVKPGYLRLRLSNVKLYVKVQLTEIDKRFVEEDPDTEDTYYFEAPQVFDLKFSIRDAMMFKPELQRIPGFQNGFIGKGLTESRARIILKDFVDFLVQKKHESELNHRIMMALTNRYSKAIMTSADILLLPIHLDMETAFYKTDFPTIVDEDDMVMVYKIFYMSYSMESFLSTCKDLLFTALDFQSVFEGDVEEAKLTAEQLAEKRKKDKETEKKLTELGEKAEKWMEDQTTKACKGLSLRDDGFDWDEDRPTQKSKLNGAEVNTEVDGASSEVYREDGNDGTKEIMKPERHSANAQNDLDKIVGKLNEVKLPTQ